MRRRFGAFPLFRFGDGRIGHQREGCGMKIIKVLCVAALTTFGVVAMPATGFADHFNFDNQMWTEDALPRGGVVYFQRAGDVVEVCDNDPGDGHAVRLKVGQAGRYIIRVANGGGCVTVHGENAGGVWDLPEPGPWFFQICRLHDGNLTGCDSANWPT